MGGESRSLISDGPSEVKPQTIGLCLKGRLHRLKVLLPEEHHLSCVCVLFFFPNKLIPGIIHILFLSKFFKIHGFSLKASHSEKFFHLKSQMCSHM